MTVSAAVHLLPTTRPAPRSWASADGRVRPDNPGACVDVGVEGTRGRPEPGRVEAVGRAWAAPVSDGLPDAARWSGWFAVALAEAVLGRRPATQLAGWVSVEVLAGLNRRQRLRPAGDLAPRTVLLSGRLQHPGSRSAEASAVLRTGTRLLVLAFRLEGVDGGWRCTALDAGLTPVRRRGRAPISPSGTGAG